MNVMVTGGRAGDEANADSKAPGRVVSIALTYGVPAEALVKTLRGINGGLYGTYNLLPCCPFRTRFVFLGSASGGLKHTFWCCG